MPEELNSIDQHPIAVAAVQLLQNRKRLWEDATVFVTDKIAFRMRDLIKNCRKNYFGVFDKPSDSITGREKIWVPLTEYVVDNVVKNIDLDTKDINLRAKKPSSRGLTAIVRNFLKNYLDNMYFGEYLDQLEQTIAIDGTCVWKTFKEKDEEYEGKTMCIKDVDLLNFFIDPAAYSIQDHCKKDLVIERGLQTPDQVKAMTGWHNTRDVAAFDGLSPSDSKFGVPSTSNMTTKMVEVFEAWGMIPLYLITGVDTDKEKLVKGHIVISNLERNPKVHLIEKVKTSVPYEEDWYTRVRGRWYGRGAAEKILMLQLWLNIIVNIRINRSYVAQLGLFKIRRASGLTAQMFSRLTVNGAIVVQDMNDVEQMVVTEASQSSYNDENVIHGWTQRVTSIFESVTGEQLPSGTTATNGVISNRSDTSQFVFIKKGIGMFLQRWVKRHVFPIISDQLVADEIIRVTGEIEELREIDERMADHLVYQKLRELHESGQFVDAGQVEKERQRILRKFEAMGRERFVKLLKGQELNLGDYDVQVFVTNEEADKGVIMQNLTQMLQTLPNLPNSGISPLAVANAIFDLMGLDTTQLRDKTPVAPQGAPGMLMPPGGAPGQPMPAGARAPTNGRPMASQQEAVTAAATAAV